MAFFVLGSPKVMERGNQIHITNIRTDSLTRDLKRVFRTTRVATYMFTSISRASFVVESFFALELYHLLDELTKRRGLGSNYRALTAIKEGLLENTWLANTQRSVKDRLNFDRLRELNYKPLDFQERFLRTYSQAVEQYGLKGMLLSGTAGSGKTFTTLALGHCLEADHIVVFCPKNAVERVWEANVLSVFKEEQSYWFYYSKQPYEGQRVAIYHYEALDKALDNLEIYKGKKVLVILDESHNLNELNAKRTQRFITFCQEVEADDVVLASGTPIKATALETVPLLKTVDPKFTDDVMSRFKKIFAGDVNKATAIIAQRLAVVSFKVEKAELKLEPPIFKNLPVKIPNGEEYTLEAVGAQMRRFVEERRSYYAKHFREYKETYERCLEAAKPEIFARGRTAQAEFERYLSSIKKVQVAHESGALSSVRELIVEVNTYERDTIIPALPSSDMVKDFKEAKTVVKYVKLKIQGECLGRVLGHLRIQAHVDMVPHIDYVGVLETTRKKTVIFTSYVEALRVCEAYLKDIDLNPITVYGDNTNVLAQTIKRFERDETLNPLIATYASLSTAVPLVMADTLIMLNAPYRDYILQQAVSRIHRLGADTQTYVYTAVLDTGDKPNISSRNFDILKWSQEQIEVIMQIESPFKVDYEKGDVLGEPAMEDVMDIVDTLPIPDVGAVMATTNSWMDW